MYMFKNVSLACVVAFITASSPFMILSLGYDSPQREQLGYLRSMEGPNFESMEIMLDPDFCFFAGGLLTEM